MDIPFYYWIVGAVLVLAVLLVLIRKRFLFLRKIKGFEARQEFWLKHRNTLAGNFVMTYTEPIEDTYILDKDSELLGRGGYGIVVLGVHKYSNIKYAIKFMNKDVLEKKNSRINRLEREYKLLKDIDHANIVRLYAVYDSAHEVGFVMELCSGGHLGHWLQNMKYTPQRIPAEVDIKSIMRQLLSAVAHMHTRGICHRDIKLQNILRESNQPNAQIKLVDFGLGTRFVGALPLKTHCGTLYSTAPEVIRESYDERCDIWSCGVVAFTLLCGRKPFEALVMHPASGETPSGKSAVTANILMGRFHFKNKEWHHRSRTCIEFVKLMMTHDYRNRWHAQEALEHSWFQNNGIDEMDKRFSFDEDDERNRTSRSFSADSGDLQSSKQLQPLLANMKRQADSSVLHQASRLAVAYKMPQSQVTDKRRQIFQAFDEDNNGSLSRQEFRKAFKEFGKLALGDGAKKSRDNASDSSVGDNEDDDHMQEILNLSEDDVDAVFNAIDVNGDNEISFTEFLAATLDPRDFDTMAINSAFEVLDVDKKGFITAEDMERVLAVTATARGRRRNSNASSGSGKYSMPGYKGEGEAPKPGKNPPIRRHHSFTLGAKRGNRRHSLRNMFSQGSINTSTKLSPVNSAVGGENSDSHSATAAKKSALSKLSGSEKSDDEMGGNEMKESGGIKKLSSANDIKLGELSKENDKDNNSDNEASNNKEEEKKTLPPIVDNRPGIKRQRSLSTMTMGDILRRPSILAKHQNVANLLKPSNSTGFSFVNSLVNKNASVAPSFVEESEYSNSEIAKAGKKVTGAASGDYSDENKEGFKLRAISTPNLKPSGSFGRKMSIQSNEENCLNEIDDRTYEQIKRAIKLCDRNNTGVVSYTDFLLAMTGNKFDNCNSTSGSNNSRRNSRTCTGSTVSDLQHPSGVGDAGDENV